VRWSPSEKTLAGASHDSHDGTVKVVDFKTGKILFSETTLYGRNYSYFNHYLHLVTIKAS